MKFAASLSPEEELKMLRNEKGAVLVKLLVLMVIAGIVAVCAWRNSIAERRRMYEREAGSLANAAHDERYLAADELDRLMKSVRPLYKGVLNTHTNLPTEPRTTRSTEPGALNYAVSEDCCTDTITVIGEDQTVIWTIVGMVGKGYVINGTAPPTHPKDPRPAGGTFSNSERGG